MHHRADDDPIVLPCHDISIWLFPSNASIIYPKKYQQNNKHFSSSFPFAKQPHKHNKHLKPLALMLFSLVAFVVQVLIRVIHNSISCQMHISWEFPSERRTGRYVLH